MNFAKVAQLDSIKRNTDLAIYRKISAFHLFFWGGGGRGGRVGEDPQQSSTKETSIRYKTRHR